MHTDINHYMKNGLDPNNIVIDIGIKFDEKTYCNIVNECLNNPPKPPYMSKSSIEYKR